MLLLEYYKHVLIILLISFCEPNLTVFSRCLKVLVDGKIIRFPAVATVTSDNEEFIAFLYVGLIHGASDGGKIYLLVRAPDSSVIITAG